MEHEFITDVSILSNDLFNAIEKNNYEEVTTILKEKHKKEMKESKEVRVKQHDLIIWNALLAKHLTDRITFSFPLAPMYNQFYSEITKTNNLLSLQEIELRLFQTYIQKYLYNLEVTTNYTVNKVLKSIHMRIESKLTIQELSKDLNLSPTYVAKVFKDHLGITPLQYLNQKKIERATLLLKTSNLSLIEIADQLGFYDLSHFTRVFTKQKGINPSSYRNHHL